MGEYEPEDSRNITGTETTEDGRWTNKSDPREDKTAKAAVKSKDQPAPKDTQ